jgi:hypothetical protein
VLFASFDSATSLLTSTVIRNSQSESKHPGGIGNANGGLVCWPALAQMRRGPRWFAGSADAILV